MFEYDENKAVRYRVFVPARGDNVEERLCNVLNRFTLTQTLLIREDVSPAFNVPLLNINHTDSLIADLSTVSGELKEGVPAKHILSEAGVECFDEIVVTGKSSGIRVLAAFPRIETDRLADICVRLSNHYHGRVYAGSFPVMRVHGDRETGYSAEIKGKTGNGITLLTELRNYFDGRFSISTESLEPVHIF